MKRTVRRLIAAAIGVAVAVTAACASNTPRGGTSPGSAPKGGTIRVGIVTDPSTFDPHSLVIPNFPFLSNLYDPLLVLGDDGRPAPGLASKFAIAPDGRSVTLTLRGGVVFPSGATMKPADVVRNVEKVRDPKTGFLVYPLAVDITDVTETGAGTVKVTFGRTMADGQIIALLTSLGIADPAGFAGLATAAAGTGPFIMREFEPGIGVTLERNAKYWGEPAKAGRIEYQVFDSTDAMVAALEAGDIDAATGIQAGQASRLRGSLSVVEAPQAMIVDQFRLNPKRAPLDNATVRTALTHAVDRESMVKNIYGRFSVPLALPFGENSPAYDAADLKNAAFDLDRAKALLSSSGVPASRLHASVLVNGADQASQRMAQIYQADLAKIGFTLEIDVRDNAEWLSRVVAGDYDIGQSTAGGGNRYPGGIVYNSFYRLKDNPILDPVFPDYLTAMTAVQTSRRRATLDAALVSLRRAMLDRAWVVSCCAKPYLVGTGLSGVTVTPGGHVVFAPVAARAG